MATKRKYPKQPKASASADVWQRYYDRCKEVDKHNSNLIKEKARKASIIKKVKSLKK